VNWRHEGATWACGRVCAVPQGSLLSVKNLEGILDWASPVDDPSARVFSRRQFLGGREQIAQVCVKAVSRAIETK